MYISKKIKKLEEIKEMVRDVKINYDTIDLMLLNNFITITNRIDDYGVQYKIKHKMSEIIMISLLTIIENANTWSEIYCFEKSNEITMGPELIEKLNLKNSIINADALNT